MRGWEGSPARAPAIPPKMARRIGWAGLALVIGIYAAFPLYWMIVTALQSGRDLFLWPPHLLPNPRHLSVFARLFATQPIVRWLENSSIVAGGVAVIAVVLSTPGAYGLSRYRRRGWAPIGFLLLLTQMLPGIVIITPLFILFRQAHILNTLGALVVVDVAFTAPIVLWVIKGFFDTIPFEIEEAALLDDGWSCRFCDSECPAVYVPATLPGPRRCQTGQRQVNIGLAYGLAVPFRLADTPMD
jgi:ABC-type glycerol-3-phosphate transport system permease component